MAETKLRPGNVNAASFGRLYERHVNGDLLAQILYVRGVLGTPRGTKNLFFAATSTNEVYAFDADDAQNTAPVWKAGPLGLTRLLNEGEICRETIGTVGITSTPVIDLERQVIYVVARHWDHGGPPVAGTIDLAGAHCLHALRLRDGSAAVSPVEIKGTDPRTQATFDPTVHRNRPGLLLLNAIIYVGFATFQCDFGHYHGWVFGYAADTLASRAIFCTPSQTSTQWGAGIWQSGNGLVGSSDGHIYFETGNDIYEPHTAAEKANPAAPSDLADAFVKLRVTPTWPGLELAGRFQPANAKRLRDGDRDAQYNPIKDSHGELHSGDTDLGSGGPVLLPGSRLVGGGKQGRYYVLNPGTMELTQDSSSPDPQRIGEGFQAFVNTYDPEFSEADYGGSQTFGPNVHGGPVYWSGPSYLYQMPEKDYLKAYHYDQGTGILHHEAGPIATAAVRPGPGMPGGHSSLSANGATDGVVWTLAPMQDATADPMATGLLHAFDAMSLRELWNDPQPELFAKFNPPTIADGKVFRPAFAQYEIPPPPVFDHTKQRIAAVSRAPGNLDLFVIGFDNRVWTNYWNDQVGWNPAGWFPIPGTAVFDHTTQQIAAVSRAPGNLDLFVIGFDNRVWTTYWNDQAGWDRDPNGQVDPNGHFFPIPATAVFDHTTQQIAAVSRAAGNLDLFVIGFDNRVWTTYWNDQAGWDRDPNGQVDPNGHFFPPSPPFGPAPIYQGSGKIIVYGMLTHGVPLGIAAAAPPTRLTIGELVERLGHRGVLATPLGPEVELADARGGWRRDFMGTVITRRQRVSDRRAAELPTRPNLRVPGVEVAASVFWSPDTGANIVMGEIRETYLRQGGPTGSLGYPIASETDTDDGRGRVSRFEHGDIIWDPKTGTDVRAGSPSTRLR
ncbi:MAG: hypothetical protein JO352_35210 [Chloroflexi bacterium]|nr:hypothetical protein [Chloroflexota bacterium]